MRHLTNFLLACALLAVAAVGAPIPAHAYRNVTRGAPLERVAVVSDSYTNGTDLGGQGPHGWPTQAWRSLAAEGVPVAADVAAEGRAGYVVRGDHGSIFGDLTARAVRPDDVLVVFFGSRNDEGVDPLQLSGAAHDAFMQARAKAPAAKLLVIGPPWPTPDVPPAVLQIRDVLSMQAGFAGAVFIDPIAERWFMDRPDLIGRDGVHPTDAGHAYLAALIAPLIRAQLPASV
ncbi:MAG: SGNH/GDSL hydrolase family protein [Mycobacterium sp.]|nr:SGNH/GDSL hydrolase family protein [Mycobacterium sp.]